MFGDKSFVVDKFLGNVSECLAFSWLSLVHWERGMLNLLEDRQEGRRGGSHHPSPQEIKANNQDLVSCPCDHSIL